MATKYSLWIVPPDETRSRLQDLVDKLADQYSAPSFTPHMTLVANISGAENPDSIKTKVDQLSGMILPFTVTLNNYGFMNEEHRCLYLLAESPELSEVYEQTAAIFPQVEDEHFAAMPHLSVLYGQYPDETKEAIIEANPILPLSFRANSIQLCDSSGPAETWSTVYSVDLTEG